MQSILWIQIGAGNVFERSVGPALAINSERYLPRSSRLHALVVDKKPEPMDGMKLFAGPSFQDLTLSEQAARRKFVANQTSYVSSDASTCEGAARIAREWKKVIEQFRAERGDDIFVVLYLATYPDAYCEILKHLRKGIRSLGLPTQLVLEKPLATSVGAADALMKELKRWDFAEPRVMDAMMFRFGIDPMQQHTFGKAKINSMLQTPRLDYMSVYAHEQLDVMGSKDRYFGESWDYLVGHMLPGLVPISLENCFKGRTLIQDALRAQIANITLTNVVNIRDPPREGTVLTTEQVKPFMPLLRRAKYYDPEKGKKKGRQQESYDLAAELHCYPWGPRFGAGTLLRVTTQKLGHQREYGSIWFFGGDGGFFRFCIEAEAVLPTKQVPMYGYEYCLLHGKNAGMERKFRLPDRVLRGGYVLGVRSILTGLHRERLSLPEFHREAICYFEPLFKANEASFGDKALISFPKGGCAFSPKAIDLWDKLRVSDVVMPLYPLAWGLGAIKIGPNQFLIVRMRR